MASAPSSTSSTRRRFRGSGSGSASRVATPSTTSLGLPPDERQRLDELLDAAADAVEAWAREGVSKAANRFNAFRSGPPTRPGRPRPARSTGRPAPTACAGPGPAGGASARQARTRDRRTACRQGPAPRASLTGGGRGPRRGRGAAHPRPVGAPPAPARDAAVPRPGRSAGGRPVSARQPRRGHGRPARREVVPRRGPGPGCRRAGLLDRPRRRDRRPRRGRAGRLAGRSGRGGRPRAADGACLRAQRADPRRVGGPGGDPRPVAERPRPGPRRVGAGAPPADDHPDRRASPPRVPSPRRPRAPGRPPRRAPATGLRARPRGGRAGRDGPPRRPGRRLPGRRRAPGPDRALRRRDRRDPGVRPHRPADGPPVESVELLPATEFLVPAAGLAEIRARLGRWPAGCPSALPPTSSAWRERARPADAVDPAPPRARALEVGDAAEVWAAILCPASGLDHVAPAPCWSSTSPARSPPPRSSCGSRQPSAAATWSLPASSPRLAGGLRRPARLEGAAPRRPDHGAHVGARPGQGDRWRARPRGPVRLARADPSARTQLRPGPRDRALARGADPVPRIVLASDQAARLAELLGDAGIPAGVTMAPALRRPAPSRSSGAA